MAITDIFKKEAKKAPQAPADSGKKTPAPIERAKSGAKATRKSAVLAGRILAGAHITEKAASLADTDQYIFRVVKTAGKKEIARAVEVYYGVSAVSVNVINVPGRRRRNRRGIFFEPGFRKAIVKIKKGQTIEAAPK